MKLSDVMSAMKLAHYPEMALVLFLGAFVVIALSVMSKRHKDFWERGRYMALSADDAVSDQAERTPNTDCEPAKRAPGGTR